MERESERNGHAEAPRAGSPGNGNGPGAAHASSGPAPGNDFAAWLANRFLGEHHLIRKVREQAMTYAPKDWPVLITGETGTGKDLLALAMHRGSPRASRNPEVIAAAGLGDTAWSVLFGHERGAFTSATERHEGVFRVAHESTVLLEDIQDLPLKVQPALLRAIEYKLFRPLSSRREVRSDVRVISSANRSLDEDVEIGAFRPDLYERLSVLKIVIPPLRAHLDDLGIYVPHFLGKLAAAGFGEKALSDGAMNVLHEHAWPRNVRQLENLLRRVVLAIPEEVLEADGVLQLLQCDAVAMENASSGLPEESDRASLERTLAECRGNKREAARRLGISPATLYKLLRRHGLAGILPVR